MRIGIFLLGVAPLLAADAADPLFDRDVLPILRKNCVGCHGPATRMAALDLHEASLVLRGGENGPVIIKGSPETSLLIKRVREGSMPPGGKNRLSEYDIRTLENWVRTGAAKTPLPPAEEPQYVSLVKEEDRGFWAFRPTSRPAPPQVRQKDLALTPVDAFLLRKLEEKRLTYSKRANSATLARRAYLDLIGLPPTPEQVAAFAADNRPGAYSRLIDQLLASPHFGERWGRHWLDLAGYVDTVGRDVQSNGYSPGKGRWKYRDYVVGAYNSDKPYDQFLREQIAGDELFDRRPLTAYTPAQLDMLTATGFLRTAEDPTDNPERDTPLLRYEVIHQTMDILTSSVMGLTVGCARCHNHKFDPIPQRDYYGLMATLTPAYNPVTWTPVLKRTLADVPPLVQASIDEKNAAIEKDLAPLRKELSRLFASVRDPLLEEALAKLPEKDRAAARKAAAAEMRNARQTKLVESLGLNLSPQALLDRMSESESAKARELERRIGGLEKQRQSYGILESLYESDNPPETYIHRRGDFESRGATVKPSGLEVLSKSNEVLERPTGFSTGRRLALAQWLTTPGTPAAALTARVYVNRVWMHLFGEGIVTTPDNFGKMGAAPTHPELLEWLSDEFVKTGWSTKSLIRQLVLSRAYQQTSLPSGYPVKGFADARLLDPDVSLVWRMRLRRLESEVIRDSVLAVSGQLNLKMGGEAVPTITNADGMVLIDENKLAVPGDRYRRSLYLTARRRYNLSMLGVFDHPVMSTNAKERGSSAVVLQSLMMMNDKGILHESQKFAELVLNSLAGADDGKLIESSYLKSLGRLPDKAELDTLSQLMDRERGRFAAEGKPAPEANRQALASICHVLLNANEFLYVE